MYIPKHFEESNIDVLHEFIRSNPFATLITNSESGLCADHLPVYLNTENPERILLQGHIAAANPLWKCIQNLQQSLMKWSNTATSVVWRLLNSRSYAERYAP